MIVWAGCEACYDERKFIGHWVDEADLVHLDPLELHQLDAYDVTVTGKHLRPPRGYTLEDFGVPPEQTPEAVSAQAEVMDTLTLGGWEYPAWLMASWFLDKEVWDMTPAEFKALYAGQWVGKPTRALRKRYSVTRAGEGWYYLWRR